MSSSSNRLKDSWYRHPILWNAVVIIAGLLLLGYLSLCFLDIWTHHGSTTVVPDVVGKPVEEAAQMLGEADLEYVISDSIYTKTAKPGTIVDVLPRAGSVVKSGREVYLTVVASGSEPVIIDILLVDNSAKQAEAYLRSKGLKVEKQYKPYEFNDIVIAAKCRGKNLTVGSKVTVDDVITLIIGRVPELEEEDGDALDFLVESALEENSDGFQEEVEAEVEPAHETPNE